ncbi:hypothetical protein [Streptomyces sp. NPDC044948]|uniref:hypothetical protein n=1 Tax=Streptomyces sp. NPDC044948 TaxID=3157092 RepID=UPI0033CA985F
MSAHTARQGIFNVLTGRAVCPAPRPDDEAEGLLAAYRAEEFTNLVAEAERRLAATTSRTVSKEAVLRFLQLEASTARAAAKAETTPAPDAPPPTLAADTTRRAHLLHAIHAGGRWKSGSVARWYEEHGYTGLGLRAARHDLAVLRDSGALVQHDEKGVRFYTAARSGGDRG